MKILPGTQETLDGMKGMDFTPENGEGVVYLKLAFIKPDTMKDGDPSKLVDDAPGVVLCGDLSKIRAQLDKWFGESANQYIQESKPKTPEERW